YRQQVAELSQLYREGRRLDIESYSPGSDGGRSSRMKLFTNLDGIKFLMHEGGCGGTREDANNLCGLLAGYIHHPNVAGATVLSLGCQHAQIPILLDSIKRRDPNFKKPLYIFEQQKSASESELISDCIRSTFP